MKDDHDREFSIADLSIQIFTVPSLVSTKRPKKGNLYLLKATRDSWVKTADFCDVTVETQGAVTLFRYIAVGLEVKAFTTAKLDFPERAEYFWFFFLHFSFTFFRKVLRCESVDKHLSSSWYWTTVTVCRNLHYGLQISVSEHTILVQSCKQSTLC